MSEDLKKLKVVIEADASRYKKAINDAKKDTKDGVNSIRNAIKNNLDPDPFNLSGLKSKLAAVQEQFKSTFSKIKSDAGLQNLDNPFKGIAAGMRAQSKARGLASGRLAYTDDYTNATDGIERMTAALERYHQQERDFAAAGTPYESEEWAKVQGKIYDAENALKSYKAQKESLEASGGDVQKNPGFSMKGAISGGLKNIGSGVASGGGKFLAAISKAGGAAASIIQKMRSGISAVGKGISGLASRFQSLRQSGGGAFDGLGGGFKKLLAYGFGIRSLFFLFNRLRSAIVAGFQNMAQADTTGQVNRNLSTLMSSLTQLKNAWAAAFAPILNVVTPFLNSLIQGCTQAANALGSLFAALTGQKYVVKAVKVNQNYAASLGSAAGNAKKATAETKKYQAQLYGFDQINKADDNSASSAGDDGGASGAGGGINPSDMFTTAGIDQGVSNLAKKIKDAWAKADFTDIGRMVADKINKSLEAIPWNKIQDTCARAAKSLATFINGITYGLDWGLVGRTIGKGLNTITLTIHTFFANTDWKALGAGIGKSIQSAFDEIDWVTLGKSLTDGIRAISDAVHGLLPQLNFASIGTDIGVAISSALDNIPWEQMIQDLVSGLTGIFTVVSNAVNAVPWGNIASRISTGITGADWAGMGRSVSDAILSILNGIDDFFTSFDWEGVGASIVSFLTSIDWLGIIMKGFEILLDLPLALVKMIKGAFEQTDWSSVGESALKGLQNYRWDDFFRKFGEFVGTSFRVLVDIIKALFYTLPEKIRSAVSGYFQQKIKEAGGNVVKGIYNGIKDAIKGIGQWIYNHIFKPFIDGFKSAFGIHSPASTMVDPGKQIIAGLFKGVTAGFPDVLKFFKDMPGKVKSAIGNAKDWIRKKGSDMIEGIKNGIDSIKEIKLFTPFKNLKKKTTDSIGDIKGATKVKGSDIVSGMASGIDSKKGDFDRKLKDLVSGAKRTLAALKETGSRAGKDLSSGLNSGFDSSAVTRKIQSVASAISSAFGGMYRIGRSAGEDLASGFASVHIPTPHIEIFGYSSHYVGGGDYVDTPVFGVDWYAMGGFPQTGELFAARESGPELVGRIGNRAAVVNNDQIVDAVSEGVFKAVVSAMDGQQNNGSGGDVVLMIDGEEIGRVIGNLKSARDRRYHPVLAAY